ncbi:MAG: D-aminoacyl-tRNA deacylase [Erysipelotrichaceae bacterium]
MKVIMQRVSYARVKVDDKVVGEIKKGYMFLVGIANDDTIEIIKKVAKKCIELRIFDDEAGKMNKSIKDVNGAILSISQFTLFADYRKGRRPGFNAGAQPVLASEMYDAFNEELKSYDIEVQTGIFGADMKCELCNDGPVTIIMDSDELGGGV